jgi:hypothetical protein
MLKPACLEFRSAFNPGERPGAEHRRTCAACAAYAETLEHAAAVRLPLPSGLKDRLRAVAGPEPLPVVRAPLPQRPLPPALRARLQAVPRQTLGGPPAAGRPPFWVLSPRYAVAASYVLAILLTGLFGNPLDRGRAAVHAVGREIGTVLERAGEIGSEWKGITSGLLSRDQDKESGSALSPETESGSERRTR